MQLNEIRTIIEKNTCAGCGKEYDQPLLVSQFGIICASYCPECIDKEDRKQQAIQKQQEEKKHKEWLESLGIKEQYAKATLDNYKPQTPSQSEALSACKDMMNGEITKMILLGSNGVGKTHLASALVKRMNGKIITAYEMFAFYRSCFSGQNSEIEILKRFSNYPLLAIDEFGRTKGSEAEENFLSVVIDNRHSANLPTIILSNLIRKRDCIYYTQDQTYCAKCTKLNCLESKLTADVISRLREKSKVIMIQGEDYRRK